nr:uncharacterized protein LOC111993444 [Quercus suber]
MIVLLPVVRVLVLLPPLHGLWVSLGLRLMMMMEWNRFQKLKRSKKIPQRSPESMFSGNHNARLIWAEIVVLGLVLEWLWFSRMKEWAEVCPRCHHDMPLVGFGMCLGLIGTHVGSWSIKGKSLRNSLLSQRNSRILGEVKAEEKHMKSLRKDIKFRLMFKGSGCNFILNRVLRCNWFVPCFILHDLWLKVC